MTHDGKIRWGILGCARISRRGLIPGINESSSGVLTAIASRSAETAKSWAEEFSIPKSYGSYEGLLADPDIDAIYLPLPNELHLPWTVAAADAGKHVLCEKPLALNAIEAKTMVDHCRDRGVLLMEAFMWRHQPRVKGLKWRVSAGEIGDLRLVRSSFSFPIDMTDWRLDNTRGGGALWDVGTYGVSTVRLFTDAEPTGIQASAHFGTSGVDLSLSAVFHFPGDVLGVIDCSFEQPFRQTYELVGTQGSFEVNDAYLPSPEPTATFRDADGKVTILAPFAGTNQYAEMVDAFARGLSGSLSDGAEDGLQQMIVLDEVLKAARA